MKKVRRVILIFVLGVFGTLVLPVVGFVDVVSSANAYDKSVMMPEAKLCPSGMSYYTGCVNYGMGCNPDGCHDDPIE